MTTKSDTTGLWTSAAFDGATFHTVHFAGRPWLAVTPLCETIGINPTQQERRLQRYKATIHLPVATARAPTGGTWVLLPLEYVAWFLLTMRPSDAQAAQKLVAWRKSLPWYLIEAHLRKAGRYGEIVKLKQTVLSAGEASPTPRYKSCITPSLVAKMKDLHRQGLALGEISKAVGYSKTAVSLCIRDKYPCILDEPLTGQPQTPTVNVINGGSSPAPVPDGG